MSERKETKGEKTKQKIIRVALKLLAKKGFENISMQMIADELDMAQSAIFVHFKTKSDLLDAVRGEVTRSNHLYVEERVQKKTSAFDQLVQHCLGNILWATENPSQAQIVFHVYTGALTEKDSKKLAAVAASLGQKRIEFYVEQMDLSASKIKNKETIVAHIHQYLLGAVLHTTLSQISVPKLTEQVEIFLKSLLK